MRPRLTDYYRAYASKGGVPDVPGKSPTIGERIVGFFLIAVVPAVSFGVAYLGLVEFVGEPTPIVAVALVPTLLAWGIGFAVFVVAPAVDWFLYIPRRGVPPWDEDWGETL